MQKVLGQYSRVEPGAPPSEVIEHDPKATSNGKWADPVPALHRAQLPH